MPALRAILIDALRQTGALGLAYRAYERLAALAPRTLTPAGADGVPLPPPHLIMQVAGTPDVATFLDGGRLAVQSISGTLARNGKAFGDCQDVLDFGCGCGRVIRHWRPATGQTVTGTDYNRDLIAWCRAHLPLARFDVNRLSPPLEYADGRFDFIYALSVFTHWPGPLQGEWIREFARVLRPGGRLLLTVHGRHYLPMLSPAERADFEAGRLVMRYSEVPGTNLCAAFHPEPYVRAELAAGFEVLDVIPEGAAGNPRQDVYLLRKPLA